MASIKNRKIARVISDVFESSIFTRANTPEIFRNGFRSFHMAVTFGLTLGGGGEDSASCEYSIERVWDNDNPAQREVMIHTLDGMDVGFSIYTVQELTEGGRNATVTHYIGKKFQRD